MPQPRTVLRPAGVARRRMAAGASTSPCRAAARTAPSPGACSTGFLEEDDLEIEAISATSAGATERRGAQARLAARRQRRRPRSGSTPSGCASPVSKARSARRSIDWLRAVSPARPSPRACSSSAPPSSPTEAVTRVFSPYQFNPANYHPLRAIVEEMIDPDGDGARAAAPSSSSTPPTSATASRGSSRRRDHRRRDPRLGLPARALPGHRDRRPAHRPPRGVLGRRLHRQPGALPALLPDADARHRHRPHQPALPRRAADDRGGNSSRINEISFNASLLRELRNIEFVNRLLDHGVIAEGAMKRNHVHSVSDDALMNQLGMVTKMAISRTCSSSSRTPAAPRWTASSPTRRDRIGKGSSVDSATTHGQLRRAARRLACRAADGRVQRLAQPRQPRPLQERPHRLRPPRRPLGPRLHRRRHSRRDRPPRRPARYRNPSGSRSSTPCRASVRVGKSAAVQRHAAPPRRRRSPPPARAGRPGRAATAARTRSATDRHLRLRPAPRASARSRPAPPPPRPPAAAASPAPTPRGFAPTRPARTRRPPPRPAASPASPSETARRRRAGPARLRAPP